jgi:hypothetical protein
VTTVGKWYLVSLVLVVGLAGQQARFGLLTHVLRSVTLLLHSCYTGYTVVTFWLNCCYTVVRLFAGRCQKVHADSHLEVKSGVHAVGGGRAGQHRADKKGQGRIETGRLKLIRQTADKQTGRQTGRRTREREREDRTLRSKPGYMRLVEGVRASIGLTESGTSAK